MTPDAAARHSPAMPAVIEASHRRSHELIGAPEHARPTLDRAEAGLAALRRAHPLHRVRATMESLLVAPATETGVILAVTDAVGRLVWVEGDRAARRRAEAMGFVPGADWSEACVGTSAPGTALATGRAVQVVGDEHYAPTAHGWNCSAVPVRDPSSGRIVAALDLTGGENAVTPHSIPLLRAAAAALEAALADTGGGASAGRVDAVLGHAAADGDVAEPSTAAAGAPGTARLRLLGRDTALLETAAGHRIELTPRHSEILLLLAAHPEGLTGPELAALLAPDGMRAVTLRAELARLRHVLAAADPSLVLRSQPYRLAATIDTDAQGVLRAIDRGRHRQALRDYAGALLPASVAPGVAELRARTTATLREAVLDHGGADALLAFLALPGHADDVEANLEALRVLPARSPKRAAIVARLDALSA